MDFFSIVQRKDSSTGSAAFTSAVTLNSNIIVLAWWDKSVGDVTGISDTLTNAYERIGPLYDDGATYWSVWGAWLSPAGADTVALSFGSAPAYQQMSAFEISGAAWAIMNVNVGFGYGTSANFSASVNSERSNALAIAWGWIDPGITTNNESYTTLLDSSGFNIRSKNGFAKGTLPFSGTITSPVSWGILHVAINLYYATILSVNTEGGLDCSGAGQALNMPATINAGDLLLAICTNDAPGATNMTISGWTEVFQTAYAGDVIKHAVFAKIAAGGDTATLVGAANDYSAITVDIVGHGVSSIANDIKKGTAATGSTNAPAPPTLSAGTQDEWLWIVTFGADDDDDTASYGPTGWGAIAQIQSADSTTSCLTAARYLVNEPDASMDPPNFAMAAIEEWVSNTLAIPHEADYRLINVGDGSLSLSSGVVKARGKGPPVSGSYSLNSGVVKARGKNPPIYGALSFASGTVSAQATLYVFSGSGVQCYAADSVYAYSAASAAAYAYLGDAVLVYADGSEHSRGKAYVADGVIYYDSDASVETATLRVYQGDGTLVFDDGSEIAIGKVYEGVGAFHFSGGTVYTSETTSSFSYTGDGTVVYEGVSVFWRTYGSARAKESLPRRPVGQDGAFTDPSLDGAWDEYPVDGVYTSVGFVKEFKPFRRYTHVNESVPSLPTESVEGILAEPGEAGMFAFLGLEGIVGGMIGRDTELQPTDRGAKETVPTGTYTLEGKPS